MKKFAVMLTVLFVLSMVATVFAQEAAPAPAPEAAPAVEAATAPVPETAPAAEVKAGDAKAPELLMKAYEKMTADVTFVMEVKTKMNNQEFATKTKAYFKDAKHYRMDSEVSGQKTRMVIDGDVAWNYMEAANMLMTMPVPPSPTEDLHKNLNYVEGKDGENVTFTFTDDATKMKVVTTINPKENLIVKINTFNEKGEPVSEMLYTDWKFEKIGDEMFKKPEGAQEMQMPAQPAPTE